MRRRGCAPRAPADNQLVGFECHRQTMGVTAEEVALVRQSFEPVTQNADESGKAFFKRLFELYPSTKDFFKHLSDSDEELMESEKFGSHRKGVIVSLAGLLKNLEEGDVSKIDSTLKRLARIHRNWKVRPEQVDYISKTLLDVLRLEAGSQLETAWTNVLNELMGSLEEKLQVLTRCLEFMNPTDLVDGQQTSS